MADLIVNAAKLGTRINKVPVITPPVKVRVYPILAEAIETGLTFGVRRIFKYDSKPRTADEMIADLDLIQHEIMAAISDVLDFGDE